MFWWENEGGSGPVSAENRSKADVLRGIVTDTLSTAAREILAVVERTVAEYEEEAAGFRQEIDRQRQVLGVLLESQVKTEPPNVTPVEPDECSEPVVKEEEEQEAGGAENPEPDVWGEQQLCSGSENALGVRAVHEEGNMEAEGKDPQVWSEQLFNRVFAQSQNLHLKVAGTTGGGSPEEDDHMSCDEFESLGLMSYIEEDEGEGLSSFGGKQRNKRPRPMPRSGTRSSLRLRMSDPKELIQLTMGVLPGPNITCLSPTAAWTYPTQEVSCPVGLQQEDFLDLLRVTFPQINNKPFDLFWTNNGRTLLPLLVETLTAEEIQKYVKSPDQAVYIRLQDEVESNITALGATNTMKIRFVAQSRTRKGIENGQGFIDLEFMVPDDSDTDGQSLQVTSSKQVKVVRCPLGLQEEDFLSQLKSLFPQLAGNTVILLFHTNHGGDLVPVKVAKLTPEDIWKFIVADGPGTTLYVQTKMDKVQAFSSCRYSSGDDGTQGTSTFKPERDSPRPTRNSHHPMNLVESDDSNIDKEDRHIPSPVEDNTESDNSLELTLEGNKGVSIKSRSRSSSQRKFKPRKCGNESSRQRRRKSPSHNPTQKLPNSVVNRNEKEMVATYSKKDASVSMSLEEKQFIYVRPVLKKKDGPRKLNKKHFCFYCRKFVQKMSRHLWLKHRDEMNVAKALSLPKNSKERKLQLEYIQKKASFEHNSDTWVWQKGKLIAWKHLPKKCERQEYAHCVYCYGFFAKRAMWRHFQVCHFKPESTEPGQSGVEAFCAFTEHGPAGFNKTYWKFLSAMHQDMISAAIKQDRGILEYGYRLFKKNENMVSHQQYIRQELRDLGRLLLEARKVTHVKNIHELLKPEHVCQVVTIAKSLSGFSEQTGKCKRPSLACRVGNSLCSLARFVKSEGLKKNDQQVVQDTEGFLQLYQGSWRFDMENHTSTQRNQNKWNIPQLVPFTQDVQKLHSHLAEKRQQHLNGLQEHPSPSNWKELAEVTLAQVVLFNRRRQEEVSGMLLSAFLSKDSSESDRHEDVSLALTPLEQKLCNHFIRITIVGNGGRNVLVLLTPLMKESLDILSEKREQCGVPCENKYLFALPLSVHYIKASDCIRHFVKECDHIKNREALTSTTLRKHIATISTVLNLKTTEPTQLAEFLGHNIAVHQKHYRLRDGTRHLAKISKVLLAMEHGRLGEYKGKSLDEIQVNVNETIGMEELSEEDVEDVSMTGEQWLEDDISFSSLHECTSSPQIQNQGVSGSDVRISGQQRSEDVVSVSSLEECTSTSQVQHKKVSQKKRGKQTAAKRWTPEEINAVEKHLKSFMVRQDVPGKADCERCISAEPQALQQRDWKAVKYFIHNRITSMRKKN